MKFLLFILPLTIFLCCSPNKSALEIEVMHLRKANHELQLKLKNYKNSIVINHTNVDDYLVPICFGEVIDKQHNAQFSTALVLAKLPDDIELTWSCAPEPMALQNKGSIYTIKNTYPNNSERMNKGFYEIKFTEDDVWKKNWSLKWNIE